VRDLTRAAAHPDHRTGQNKGSALEKVLELLELPACDMRCSNFAATPQSDDRPLGFPGVLGSLRLLLSSVSFFSTALLTRHDD
jgi:hypothetical protein